MMTENTYLWRAAGLRVALVLLSLAVVWFKPFYGSTVALVAVIALQFAYPGWLLARVLGVGQRGHPMARLAWVLAAAFGLAVALGGMARLMAIPVSSYLLGLHVLMLALALLPARKPVDEPPSEKPTLAAMLLVFACCAVVLGVGAERSRVRFNGYEDQTVFVELVDWLSRDPADPTIDSRRIALVNDQFTRWDFEGWSYNHAAWVQVSGVRASQLIWFDLTPLFVWMGPVAMFGLAYALTRRESVAAFAAAALTLVGLMTIDSLITYNSTLVYGQFSLFQVNSLRTFATALLSPLALMVALRYVRRPDWALLLLTLLIGVAVAMSHVRPAMTFIYTVGATAVVWWLARPSIQRFAQTVALAVVLAVVLALPVLVKPPPLPTLATSATLATPAATETEPPVATPTPEPVPELVAVADPEEVFEQPPETLSDTRGDSRGDLIQLRGLPLVGDSFIVEPQDVFYHPAIIVAVALGLVAVWWWRRSLAAAYIATSTVTTLLFLFVPGVTPIMTRITSPTVIASLIFAVPVPLILGLATDVVLSRLVRHPRHERIARWAVAVGAVVAMLVLLFEPFPIPASARDQIRASNVMQHGRAMRPSDEAMVAALQELTREQPRSVVLTPHPVGNFVSEDVPYAFITGGRHQGNDAFGGTTRFLSEGNRPAPWLDAQDMAFLREWDVTHVVLEADDTRVPQLFIDERFEFQAAPAGYVIFAVPPDSAVGPQDDIWEQMNDAYRASVNERWSPAGFALERPGNPEQWRAFVDAWTERPPSDEQRLGLAFAHMLAGDDAAAAADWQALAERYPEVAYFAPALAETHQALHGVEAARDTLLTALGSDEAAARVLAARQLLTESYLYALSSSDLDRVIAVTEADVVTWDQLAVYDQPEAIRRRVVLMLSRERWDVAARWSETLPEAEVDPRDFVTRALVPLAQGDDQGALDVLKPATDPDRVAANRYVHPDRWRDNSAEHLWLMLQARQAEQAGDHAAAQALYRRLTNTGVDRRAADYFTAENAAERGELLVAWSVDNGLPAPEPVSPLEIAVTGRLFAMNPVISETPDGDLRVEVTFGNLHEQPFPVREWRVQVISPDASVFYADEAREAIFVPGALSRVAFALALPDGVAPDTDALLVVKALYDERVELSVQYVPFVLNPSGR